MTGGTIMGVKLLVLLVEDVDVIVYGGLSTSASSFLALPSGDGCRRSWRALRQLVRA